MTEIFLLISKLMAGGLRFLIGLFLIYKLLAADRPDRKGVLVGVAGSFAVTLAVSCVPLNEFLRMGVEAVWIAFCAGRLRKSDMRKSLFVGISYEIAISMWQFLFSAGMGMVFRSEIYLNGNSLPGQIPVWVLHFLVVVLMVYLLKKPDMCKKEGRHLTTAIVIAGFFAVVTLSEQSVLVIPDDTLTMWIILSMVLMMLILVFQLSRQYEVEKEVARLKSEQAELLEHDYTALNQAYEVNAKLFHDFHNHIGALRQMLLHENYGGAMAYLDELQEPIREMADTVWTGDETVDFLINSKMASALAEQIRMDVQAEFPRHTNIRSADMCAIVGNLLDNALEAARKVPDSGQRFVSLTIRRINQMLVIKVENGFADVIKAEGGNLRTTKTEEGLHGWGLKSAQAAAEKYDGMVQTTYAGAIFRAVATLSYHPVREK